MEACGVEDEAAKLHAQRFLECLRTVHGGRGVKRGRTRTQDPERDRAATPPPAEVTSLRPLRAWNEDAWCDVADVLPPHSILGYACRGVLDAWLHRGAVKMGGSSEPATWSLPVWIAEDRVYRWPLLRVARAGAVEQHAEGVGRWVRLPLLAPLAPHSRNLALLRASDLGMGYVSDVEGGAVRVPYFGISLPAVALSKCGGQLRHASAQLQLRVSPNVASVEAGDVSWQSPTVDDTLPTQIPIPCPAGSSTPVWVCVHAYLLCWTGSDAFPSVSPELLEDKIE